MNICIFEVVEAAAAAAAAAAEAAASGDGRMRSMKQQINPFPIGATVSRSDGMNADISDLIHPTPALQVQPASWFPIVFVVLV